MCKSSCKRKVYSNIGLLKETKSSKKTRAHLPPKSIRKRKTKPKFNRMKEIIKIREEINKIETKKTTEKGKFFEMIKLISV